MLQPEIEESLQEFNRSLNTTIPLRHYWEYIDTRRINCKIQTEKDKAIQNFRQVLAKKDGKEKRVFAEKFHSEVDRLADAHRKKNEDLKDQAHSLLQKRREGLCADFKSSAETKLLLHPDMDLKSFEEFLKAGKELGKSYFEYHSNFGNDGAYNNGQISEEKVLRKELETIGNLMLKQRRGKRKSVSDQDGEKLLQEKTHSLLKKHTEELCEDFQSAIKVKLLIAPNMDLDLLKDLMETGKELAKGYFEYHSNFGDSGRYNEDQIKEQELEQQLKKLGHEMLKEQRRHLKSISEEEAKKLLEKLKESVLEMAEQVKADSRKWTKRKYELNLKERIQAIRNYVNENGRSVLSEDRNREIFAELMKLEAGEKMSADEFIKCAEGFNIDVKFDIVSEVERSDIFLVQDGEGTAPEVNLSQNEIKEEVVEKQDGSHDLETLQDIDVKIEFDGMVVQKSSIKPGLVEKRSYNQNREIEKRSAENDIKSSYKRQKLSTTPTTVGFPAIDESISSSGKDGEGLALHHGQRLPLTQLFQLYKDAQLCETTNLENGNILTKFVNENPNVSLYLLKEGLQKIIDDFVKKTEDPETQSKSFLRKQVELAEETLKTSSETTLETNPEEELNSVKALLKNGEHRIPTESFLKKEIGLECDKFKISLEAKLKEYPEMDLKTVEELLESGKLIVTSYFEYHWNRGNVDYEKQKKNLKDKLDHLGQVVLKTQRKNLEGSQAKKFLEEVKTIVLERSEDIKCYMDAVEGKVSKSILKERVQNLFYYLTGKGEVRNEKHRKVYLQLLGTVKHAMKFLGESEHGMAAEELINWTKQIDERLKFYCTNNLPGSSDIQNRNDPGIPHTDVVSNENNEMKCLENAHCRSEVDIGVEETREIIVSDIFESGSDGNGDTVDVSDETVSNELQQNEDVGERMDDADLEVEAVNHAVPLLPFKRLRRMSQEASGTEVEVVNVNAGVQCNLHLYGPDKNGEFPLLRAIENGESVESIKEMLDDGAYVHVKNEFQQNAASLAMHPLIYEQQIERTPSYVLEILKLLVDNGFDLLNEGDDKGSTPLSDAMQAEDLNEELLEWFFSNGADFNAADENGDSVLFKAIRDGRDAHTIRKILHYGGDPNHVNKLKQNALHVAALHGNDSAMKIWIDKLDVNAVDINNHTPLHLLIQCYRPDKKCLEMLLQAGADFEAKCNQGYTPLVAGIKKYCKCSFLVKVKDILPINQQMASDALTALLKRVNSSFWRMGSSYDFNIFLKFLIEEKNARLRLKDANQWSPSEGWECFGNRLCGSPTFSEGHIESQNVSHTANSMEWVGDCIRIKVFHNGTLECRRKRGTRSIPVENVLTRVMDRRYTDFKKAIELVRKFCAD